jgi:hypothetical protein
MARYEWVHDQNNYRGMIFSSQYKVNLTGAFENCPVPTLITEGRWDLTWNTDKPDILHKNHPGSELVFFEQAGHGIYEEEPDKFFKVLKNFIKKLPDVSSSSVSAFKDYLVEWDKKRKENFEYKIRSAGWGRSGSQKLAADYSREWLGQFTTSSHFLIWQGHMLDLLGKRKEALACYTQVADMNIDESWQHSQYGLAYKVSPYARERMKTPFKRIENKDKD